MINSNQNSVPFFNTYFPDLSEMNAEQLGFFYKWQQELKNGNYLDVNGNLGYLFIHLYEVTCGSNYDEIITQISEIQNHYGEYSKIEEYCNKWISECYIAKNQYEKALAYAPNNFNIIMNAGKLINIREAIQMFNLDYRQLTKFGRSNTEAIVNEVVIIYGEFEKINSINLIEECTIVTQNDSYFLFTGNPKLTGLRKPILITRYQFDKRKFQTIIPEIARVAENRVREKFGLPKIGQGWLSETQLFFEIEKAFPKYDVIQHKKLSFLGNQHIDIFITQLNIGLEYQGEQHDNPIDYFGGEETYAKNVERDQRKRNLCDENGMNLIYVYPKYSLEDVLVEIKNVSVQTGVTPIIKHLYEKDLIEIQDKIDLQYFKSSSQNKVEDYINNNQMNTDLHFWLNDHPRRINNETKKEIDNNISEYLRNYEESIDPLDKHSHLNRLIRLYYKYKEYPGFIEKCLEFGLKDIDLFSDCLQRFELKNFDSLTSEYKNALGHNPVSDIIKKQIVVNPFTTVINYLALIYEKFGEIDLGIDLINKAINLYVKEEIDIPQQFQKKLITLQKLKT